MKKLAIGLDFCATWVKAGLVDQDGKVTYKFTEKTEAFLGRWAVIEKLELIVKDLINKPNISILGIGIGSPGPIDFVKGVIKNRLICLAVGVSD